MRDRDQLRNILTEALWLKPTVQQSAFRAADVMTIHVPVYLPPSLGFLSALETALPDVASGKIRKPETCLAVIWAAFEGVHPRTVRKLLGKKPSSK